MLLNKATHDIIISTPFDFQKHFDSDKLMVTNAIANNSATDWDSTSLFVNRPAWFDKWLVDYVW